MNEIPSRLKALSDLDRERRLFGAGEHDYKLNAPIDPIVLSKVEKLIDGCLPDDYRRFLSIGNGGAGPYYGVLPLEESISSIEFSYGSLAPLSHDSPLTETIDIGVLCNAPADWNEHRAKLEADTVYAARYEKYRAEYMDDAWCNGKLPIVEYGSGEWFFLVVRGPARGTVWLDALSSCSGLFNLRIDFATFYKRWLDDASSRLDARNFSPGRGSLEFGDH